MRKFTQINESSLPDFEPVSDEEQYGYSGYDGTLMHVDYPEGGFEVLYGYGDSKYSPHPLVEVSYFNEKTGYADTYVNKKTLKTKNEAKRLAENVLAKLVKGVHPSKINELQLG